MPYLRDVNLNSLRIVESAARLRSFTLAGEEQLITASAVSQRVKNLEDQLRFKIFKRDSRSVTLTPEGEEFVARVKHALDEILAARMEINYEGRSNTLKISALPTFAMRWLLPRLPEFQEREPDIHLSLSQSYRAVDFVREDIDVAIRYGQGPFPGLFSALLFKEDLIPVCASQIMDKLLAQKPDKKLTVHDLAHATLLHSNTCTANWRSWLEHHHAAEVLKTAKAATFDSCMLSFAAANAGMGFAVANRAYVAEDLKQGRLVAPFDTVHPNRFGWHFVCPRRKLQEKRIAKFKNWLLAKAAIERQDHQGYEARMGRDNLPPI